jgi:hypothetical protein
MDITEFLLLNRNKSIAVFKIDSKSFLNTRSFYLYAKIRPMNIQQINKTIEPQKYLVATSALDKKVKTIEDLKCFLKTMYRSMGFHVTIEGFTV